VSDFKYRNEERGSCVLGRCRSRAQRARKGAVAL